MGGTGSGQKVGTVVGWGRRVQFLLLGGTSIPQEKKTCPSLVIVSIPPTEICKGTG